MVKEKIAKLLIIVLLCIIVYKAVDVYAAYKSMVEESFQGNIEPWVIFVNDTDITKTETATFDLTNMISNSQYTKTGKIAPGTKLKIPIKIDASKTKNLDVRYDITLEGVNNEMSILKVEDVFVNNTDSSLVRIGVNTYTGVIDADSFIKNHDLNISLIWENNEQMNERDTELGTSEQRIVIQMPITVRVTQYMEEEIKEYLE